MKIKTFSLYFGKSRSPRWALIEGGCELQFCPRRKKVVGGIYMKNNTSGLLKKPPM
jgi:hypothetical protein